MKTFLYILSIAVLFAGGCVSGESSFRSGYDFGSLEKIAVVSIEGDVYSETAKDQIAEFFAMELLENGYAPIGRAQVRAFLGDQELELTDINAIEISTQVGAILKVPAVLVVSVPHFNEEITMTAQLINVQDGSTLWMGRGSGKTGRTIPEAFLGIFTGTGSTSSRDEMMLSDPFGMMVDEQTDMPLTPLEADKIRQVVTKICRSLPLRDVSDR